MLKSSSHDRSPSTAPALFYFWCCRKRRFTSRPACDTSLMRLQHIPCRNDGMFAFHLAVTADTKQILSRY
eukprot:6214695-Pleurochrysis_carterae.AAC.9